MIIPRDTKWHFAVCAIISAGLMVLFRAIGSPVVTSILAAWLTAMGAGLGKEWGDRCDTDNEWSWGDVAADAVGATLGACLMSVLWLL